MVRGLLRRPLGEAMLVGVCLLAIGLVVALAGGPSLERAEPGLASSGLVRAPQRPAARGAAPVAWCGTDATSADRADVVASPQIHAVYAIPSDGVDRFGPTASQIATDLSAVDEWWRAQDPSRTPRFDYAAFAGCSSTFGNVDISFLRLPQPAAAYTAEEGRFPRLAADVQASGFMDVRKKYLVYYDGPVDVVKACGTAYRGPATSGGRYSVAAVWLARGYRGCGDDLGRGGFQASTAAHELLHQLGALPSGAPHACPGDDGHPCDFGNDVLFGRVRPAVFGAQGLDVGRDDYYGHSGTWWDVQDSRWLAVPGAPRFALRVSLEGSQTGDVVQSDPPAIDCPAACDAVWESGEVVRLLPLAGGDSRFLGWSGACSGSDVCEVGLDSAKEVSARFGPASYTLGIAVTGRGRVVAEGLGFSCSKRCSGRLEADAVARLRAVPAKGWRFARWNGACHGRQACRFQAVRNLAVGAVFRRA